MRKRPDRSAHTCKQRGSQLAFHKQYSELAFGVSYQGSEPPVCLNSRQARLEDSALAESNKTNVLPVIHKKLPLEANPLQFVFVKETIPELKPWFKQFYAKYRFSELRLIWVSIDRTPNATYFAPDWWQHFREEYLVASAYKKEQLLEMLQEKLSGEKPSRHVQWPPAE